MDIEEITSLATLDDILAAINEVRDFTSLLATLVIVVIMFMCLIGCYRMVKSSMSI